MRRISLLFIVLMLAAGCAEKTVRFATFNASLNRDRQGQLLLDMARKDDPQIRNVAEIIQRANPDVLLINEFDYDRDGRALYQFEANYLGKSQNGAPPIKFDHHFFAPVNTGIASGHDLDRDGKAAMQPGTREYGADALGFGLFPGQYGMVLLSKFPIETKDVRTFQRLKWKDVRDPMLPTSGGQSWYSQEALDIVRLSSKSHWDIPIQIGGKIVHVLASHPTPPAFDGPEDRNGKRNHDEIRLWNNYITGGPASVYIRDDTNVTGGLDRRLKDESRKEYIRESFVVMGDLNADPNDGASAPGAILQLLANGRLNSTFAPESSGAAEAAQLQGGSNAGQRGEPRYDTADFGDTESAPGNLRCDYVLPSKDLKVIGGGVYWPVTSDPLSRLVRMEPQPASSDHRLVWVDVKF